MNTKVDRNRLHNTMQSNNGEVRLMPARYGGGWHCALALEEQYERVVKFDSCGDPMDIWDVWEDLVSGDNAHFEAAAALEGHKYSDDFFLTRADRPEDALAKAEYLAMRYLRGVLEEVAKEVGGVE